MFHSITSLFSVPLLSTCCRDNAKPSHTAATKIATAAYGGTYPPFITHAGKQTRAAFAMLATKHLLCLQFNKKSLHPISLNGEDLARVKNLGPLLL